MALIDNLVSYYKLDESSGNAADSVGSNTLTNNNTVTYSAGKINNGADITGSTQSLSIADGSQTGLDLTTAFSFQYWWYTPSSIGATQAFQFVDKFVGTGNQRSYRTYYDKTTGLMYLDVSGNGSTADSFTWSFSPSVSTWYHLVFTWNGSTKKANLYINGTAQTELTGSVVSSLYNATADFVLGNYYAGGAPANKIDECAVWSRVLSSGEVTSLYASGNGWQYPFSTSYTLDLTTGTFTLTGIDILIGKSLTLELSTGNFALTGIDIEENISRIIGLSTGSFSLTGYGMDLAFGDIVNVSKPITSFINQSKVSVGETWGTITTSWQTESRDWLEVSQLFDNLTKISSLVTNQAKP